jgi:hypothetical protein
MGTSPEIIYLNDKESAEVGRNNISFQYFSSSPRLRKIPKRPLQTA